MEKKTNLYIPPYTGRTRVEVEQPTCAATSGDAAKVDAKKTTLEVEDYGEVTDQITFE